MPNIQNNVELVRLFSRAIRSLSVYGEEHRQQRITLENLLAGLGHALEAEPKITFVAQGNNLLAQGAFVPLQDSAVRFFLDTLRARGVMSLSVLPGVSEDELKRVIRFFSAKSQESSASAVQAAGLDGLERIRVNDVRYVEVRDGKPVPAPDGPAGAPATGTAGEGAPGPAPLDRLIGLLQSYVEHGDLPEARSMAIDVLASSVEPGTAPIGEQVRRATERIPSALHGELATPEARVQVSAAVVARQIASGAGVEAVRKTVQECAPRMEDAVPLMEALARALQRAGLKPSLETQQKLMKLLPGRERLQAVQRGCVLLLNMDAERVAAYEAALTGYGYTVKVATRAREAIDRVTEGPAYAAMVTDVFLPDTSCGMVLSKLKRAKMMLPVVIASPKADTFVYDFEIFTYPKKKLVSSQDPEIVAAAVYEIVDKRGRAGADDDAEDRQRARAIQQAFVPRDLPALRGWETAFAYAQVQEVGGDYLDVFPLDGGRLGIVIGDVSVRGFSGALIMMMVRSAFRIAAPGAATPAEAVARVNRLIKPDLQRGMFVPLVYGCLQASTGRLTLVNCGFVPPVLYDHGGAKARMLQPGGAPLGVADPEKFDATVLEEEFDLDPGDHAVFYSDGVIDALNGKKEEFGNKAFLEVVTREAPGVSRKVVDAVQAALAAHRGDVPPSDDVTLLDLRRSPA
jgi:serine phosphatase RsbU (regulator of sigma subunit)